MKNLLKEKMQQGKPAIGTFLGMGSPATAECLALSGMDYFIVDTEHGPFDVETTMDLVRAAEVRGTTPLVRVKDGQRNSILKMLDIGAQGLIIPFLNSVEEMKAVVSYGKYSPIGSRGVAMARGAGYGYAEHAKGTLQEYFDVCNRETMLIPQCETLGCLDNIEEITAMEGIDGIFVGPFDLSTSMGIPGQFDDPDFKKAVERVLTACKKNGKFSIIYCPDNQTARERIAQGFDSVTVACDYTIYTDAFKRMIAEITE